MSIYVIADLHLSFEQNKPMNIFGENWNEHELKIKKNWIETVNEEDTVVIPGDFSWATYIEETKKDFEYLNSLPGRKILLKGNHDYWWTTLSKMNKFIEENNFENIEFMYNNCFCIEDKILVGTRGWTVLESENSEKMINRECERLTLSIKDGISKYGNDKEIICFMHYPPITETSKQNSKTLRFVNIMKKYNISKCFYGHLHGKVQQDAYEGKFEGIQFKLVSSDYLNFKLFKI